MASSWSSTTPLTAPPIQPAAPLTHRAARPDPARSASDPVAPEPGRVVGLTAVARPVAPPTPVEPPQYFQELPPLRHAPARPIVEHAPLTAATADYVGEPVAPARPSQAPFVRSERLETRPEPAVEAKTEAGARFREALANLHNSGHPRYEPGREATEQPPPPRAVEPQPPAEDAGSAGQAPKLMHRRTLAESRRLGLGAPLRHDGEQAETGSEPTAADPATTRPAAPADAEHAATTPTDEPAVPKPQPAPSVEPPPRFEPEPPRGADGPPDDDAGPPPPPREPLRTTPVVRPLADPNVRPTTRTAPLVFRAAPRPAVPDTPAPRPTQRAIVSRPPSDLAQALRASHGIDVADVPIRRDVEATSTATRLGTRAFTRRATVYLPEQAGPVSDPETRALLVHELIHASQQRRLGTALPGEHTSEGQALEAEARAAEHAYGGTQVEPLRHAPPPVSAQWVEDQFTQRQIPSTYAPAPMVSGNIEPLRHDIELIAEHAARHVVSEHLAQQQANQPQQQVQPGYIPGLLPPAPPGLVPQQQTAHQPPPLLGGGGGGGGGGSVSSPPTRPTGNTPMDENTREQHYLDILNAAHDRNHEDRQTSLSASDREAMYAMWGPPGSGMPSQSGTGAGAGSTNTGWEWVPGRGFVATGATAQANLRANALGAWGAFGAEPSHSPPATATAGATGAGAHGPGATGTAPTATGATAGGATGAGATGGASGATGTGATGASGASGPSGARGTGGTGSTATGWEWDPVHGFVATGTTAQANLRANAMAAWGGFGAIGAALGYGPPDPHAVTGASGAGAGAGALGAGAGGIGVHAGVSAGVGAQAHAGATAGAAATAGVSVHAAVGATGASAAVQQHHAGPLDTSETVAGLDMEALSVRIWEHLRSRLRQELLIDRERAGLLTDFR